MSDYCRNKCVMYPIDDEVLKQLGIEDAWEIEYNLLNREDGKNLPHFEIEAMESNWECRYYLSYVLYHTYGEDAGEFGHNRFLTPAEQEKYKPIFETIIPSIDPSKLKYVDYCYYNATESPDFYLNSEEEVL